MLIVTVLAVLSQFGIETTSVIAVFGAAGLAIGLALQRTLSNVVAGYDAVSLSIIQSWRFCRGGRDCGHGQRYHSLYPGTRHTG